jgi:hypothetical protein
VPRKVMAIHETLLGTSRLRAWSRTQPHVSWFDTVLLAGFGCCAALFSAFVDLPDLLGSLTGVSMQVPGNTILMFHIYSWFSRRRRCDDLPFARLVLHCSNET